MPFQEFTTVVEIEGQKHEVTVALPDSATAYTSEEVRELFIPKKEFERRASSIAEKQVREAMQSPETRQAILSEYGIRLNDDGKPELPSVGEKVEQAIARARADWEKNELSPLNEENQTLRQKLDTRLNRSLEDRILAAANQYGVAEDFTKPLMPGRPPAIVQMVRDVFGYDEESDDFLVREGDGYAMSRTPKADRMYKDVTEFMAEFLEERPNLVDQKRQRGPNTKTPGGPRGPVDVKTQIAEAEAAGDFYRANELKAQLISRAK